MKRDREELQRNREETKAKLEKAIKNHERFMAKLEKNSEETKAKVEKAIKNHEIFMAKLDTKRAPQEQEGVQEKVEWWDTKIARMKEKIERLSDLWTENMTMHHSSEEAMSSQDQERPGTSTHFFTRPAP